MKKGGVDASTIRDLLCCSPMGLLRTATIERCEILLRGGSSERPHSYKARCAICGVLNAHAFIALSILLFLT